MEKKNIPKMENKGNPLVTAERLHRFKCPYCGSKDKNIINTKAFDDREEEKTYGEWVDCLKIVCCNDCGHTMIFSHSAQILGAILSNSSISMAASDKFVRNFHLENHDDPKINPHVGEYPARNGK